MLHDALSYIISRFLLLFHVTYNHSEMSQSLPTYTAKMFKFCDESIALAYHTINITCMWVDCAYFYIKVLI